MSISLCGRHSGGRVEELDEFNNLVIAKSEDVTFGRLGRFAGTSTLERNRTQHHNAVVLGEESFRREKDHLSRRTELREILLGVGFTVPAFGEVQPRVLITQRIPSLDAIDCTLSYRRSVF